MMLYKMLCVTQYYEAIFELISNAIWSHLWSHLDNCVWYCVWSCWQYCFWFCFQYHDWCCFQWWKSSVSMGSRDLIEPTNLKNWVLKSINFHKSVKRDFQYFHVISKTKSFGTLQLETPKELMLCGLYFLLCCVWSCISVISF